MSCPHGDDPSRCWRCLQARLREAEERHHVVVANMAGAVLLAQRYEAERDAAIERGKQVYKELEIWHRAHKTIVWDAFIESWAEAAERNSSPA